MVLSREDKHRMTLRTLLLTAIAGCLAAAVVSACLGCGREPEGLVSVDGHAITRAMLAEELARQHGAEKLRELVEARLIEDAAEREGIKLTPSQLENRMRIEETRHGSARELREVLKEQGRTMADLKEELRRDVMLDMMAEASTEVSEAEIESYYRTNIEQFREPEKAHAWMIIFPDQDSLEAIRVAALEPGSDFRGLARAFSEDPGTRDGGGDMGRFSRDDYAQEITDVAFALAPGEISQVFAAPDGWCLLKLDRKFGPRVKPLDDVREAIIGRIKRERHQEARLEWVTEEWNRARVAIRDPSLRARVEAELARETERMKRGPRGPRGAG